MEIPQKGDSVVRTEDGARFTVAEVVDAGGENLYRMEKEGGGERLEIEEGAFVRGHEETKARFEVVR